MSKLQAKATFITILFAALGVYINAFFNYSNMMMSRSRFAIEQIKYVSESFVRPELKYGRSCVAYVAQNFDDSELERLWKKSSMDFLLINLDARKDGKLLQTCLASYKVFDKVRDFEAFIDTQAAEKDLAQISQNISRQVFSFLNTYETVFRSWKENKADLYILCEQMKNAFIERESVEFITKSKAVLLNRDHDFSLIQESYPNSLWYLEGRVICEDSHKTKLWFKNFIEPLLP